MRYPVVLHTDDGVRFGVIVPDFPGCFSSGETLDQALDCVVEAIELHLEGLVEAGGEVQAPRSIAEHRSNPDFAGGVWATVAVDVSRFDSRAGTTTLARMGDIFAMFSPGFAAAERESHEQDERDWETARRDAT